MDGRNDQPAEVVTAFLEELRKWLHGRQYNIPVSWDPAEQAVKLGFSGRIEYAELLAPGGLERCLVVAKFLVDDWRRSWTADRSVDCLPSNQRTTLNGYFGEQPHPGLGAVALMFAGAVLGFVLGFILGGVVTISLGVHVDWESANNPGLTTGVEVGAVLGAVVGAIIAHRLSVRVRAR